MLTDADVADYRAFGFTVLRGLLAPGEALALRAEVDGALRDAYGTAFDDREQEFGGIAGHDLPMMGPRTPRSRDLVGDPRLLGTAARLLGTTALPGSATGTLFFGSAPPHDDYGIPVEGVKFVAYLEPLTAADGALRLLPCSHLPGVEERLAAWRAANPVDDEAALAALVERLPLTAAATRPGDVIAFGFHTWHASVGGRDRYQWSVEYHADPAGEAEHRAVAESVADDLRWAQRHPGYPHWDDTWLHPRDAGRAALSARLRELGMFRITEDGDGAPDGQAPHRS